MDKKVDKKQITLLAVAATVVGAYMFYEFVIYDDGYSDDFDSYSNNDGQLAEQSVAAPREATLEEYRQATEDDSLIDPGDRGEIEELYHRRVVAQLSAEIAAFENQKNASEIETERSIAEVEEMRARIQREDRLVALQERESQNNRSSYPGLGGDSAPSSSAETADERVAAIDAEIERRLRQAIPRPERAAMLHQAKADYAMVSVDGAMRRIAVGQSAAGVRLISTNESNGSAVLHGNASGERVTITLGGNSSRRLATVRPLTGDDGDDGDQDGDQ